MITLHFMYDFIYKAKLRTHVVAQEKNEDSLTITYDTIRACYLSIRAKLYLLRYIHNSLNKILCTSQFS